MKFTEYPKSQLDYFTIEDNDCVIKITNDNHVISSHFYSTSDGDFLQELHIRVSCFGGVTVVLLNDDAVKFVELVKKL